MSFATFWTYALGASVVLEAVALGFVYRQRTKQPQGVRQPFARTFLIAFACIAVAWLVSTTVASNYVDGLPTFVDKVRNGKITVESVRCIQIIQDHGTHENVLVEVRDRQQVSACLDALASSSIGLTHRNHPQGLYSGSLRVEMEDSASHLIPFHVMRYEGQQFAYYYSFHNQDYGLDQNCYESTDIIPFLADHDPRFPR